MNSKKNLNFSKTNFDAFIEECVKKEQSLESTTGFIEIIINCKLGEEDNFYLENKYIEAAIEKWFKQAPALLLEDTDNFQLLDLVEKIGCINTFENCSQLLNKSKLTRELAHLTKTSVQLKSKETQYISKFKYDLLVLISLKTEHLKDGFDFLECFSDILTNSEDLTKLWKEFNVKLLQDQDNEELSIKQFLTNVKNSSLSDRKLKRAAELLLSNSNNLFTKKVKEIISNYLKPVEISFSVTDGRKVLEVIGKHLVVSDILKKVESHPKFTDVEEVRFVRAEAIHADSDLNKILWQGKNLVLYCKTLIVNRDKTIKWNVSGRDAEDINFTAAGTRDSGSGLPGVSGKDGESGGNVVIIASYIKNAQNLLIVSNGGNGSKGQDGGKGNDGKDGDFIDKKTFVKDFPPFSKFLNSSRLDSLKKTMYSTIDRLDSVQEFNLGGSQLGPISKEQFSRLVFAEDFKNIKDMYFDVTTKTQCRITFSFYTGSYFKISPCQSLLLYKGADGENGMPGGTAGSGGNGGLPGDIEIEGNYNCLYKIMQDRENGERGAWGQPGAPGKSGKNGADRAYTDCSVSWPIQWPKIVTPDDMKLKINYNFNNNSERIYCPHNAMYAEVIHVKETIGKQHHNHNQNHTGFNYYKEHESHVKRKKTIDKDSIRVQYKDENLSFDFIKLKDCLEKTNENIKKMKKEESLENENVTSEFKIMKMKTYSSNNFFSHEVSKLIYNGDMMCIDNIKESTSEIPVAKLIELVKVDQENEQLWSNLIKENLSLNKLKDLLSYLPENNTVKNQFWQKFQLLAFECVETTLKLSTTTNFPDKYPKHIDFRNIPKQNLNSMFAINNAEESFSRAEIYFLYDSDERRQEILKLFNACLPNCHGEVLREFMLTFFKEFTTYHGDGSAIAKVIKRYNIFEKDKSNKLQVKLTPIKSILSLEEHEDLNKALIKSLLEQTIESKLIFENLIQKDSFHKSLYFNFVQQSRTQYNWENPFGKKPETNDLFKKQLEELIVEKGSSASFYRIFIAFYFQTNILLYTVDERNQIMLVDSYNTKANKKIHILKKEDKFFCLNVNKDFEAMLKHHQYQGELYSKLLSHICSCTERKQFEEINDLFPQKLITSNCYKGVDEPTRMHVKINHILRQDEDVKKIVESFSSDADKTVVNKRLQNLKFDFSGYVDILYFMSMLFQLERSHISAKELCIVINYALDAAAKGLNSMSQISWIIASYPQRQWLLELTILNLEIYFKTCLKTEQKENLRKDLQMITEKETIMLFIEKLNSPNSTASLQCIQETLYLLGRVHKAYSGLETLDLEEWKYYLKDRFWALEVSSIFGWTKEELHSASYYLVLMENSAGTDICNKFVNLIKKQGSKLNNEISKKSVLDTLKMLLSQDAPVSRNLEILSLHGFFEWKQIFKKQLGLDKERNLDDLIELISSSNNTSEEILKNLPNIELYINGLNTSVNEQCDSEQKLRDNISTLLQDIKRISKSLQDIEKECTILKRESKPIPVSIVHKQCDLNILQTKNDSKLAASVVMAINLKCKIKLRDTQILTIILMLKHSKNVLSQVATGEGKSLIVVAVAIINAVKGNKVDIITSSRVLAERDGDKYKAIYKLFNVNVGHNCSEHLEERKKAYSNNQVVYGELANFQRDYLLHNFYNQNILGDRTFEAIIVDEVDSMLLDKGNNILYLSHEIPGMDKLEPLFLFIWESFNLPSGQNQPETIMDIANLKAKILYDMYGIITKENIKELDTSIPETYVNKSWKFLIREGIINEDGHVLKQNIEDCCLDQYEEVGVDKMHLKYLLEKVIGRNKSFEIPNYFKSFVEAHLNEWIMSANRAMLMESGIDYVVDVDRSGTSSDRNPNITIVDRDTGTDLVNSQWDGGLHQFLQIKHGCRLSLMNLKAVFVSNVTYIKLYNTLYGLTGTLGSKRERELLKEIYEVDFVMIPSSKTKKYNEMIPILCSSTEKWLQAVAEEVYKVTEKRSVLIICETVNDVLAFKEKFENHKCSTRKIYVYKRDYENFQAANNLEPGCIIVSTNLAGRGTNITLSKKLIEDGGLHVCLTFLPSNCRVEEQAYGRAARNGEPGSAQLIFKDIITTSALRILELKKQRDVNELLRIADIKNYHSTQIQREENWFKNFKHVYVELQKSKHPVEIKSILFQECLDQWSFWLDLNNKVDDSAIINPFLVQLSQLCDIKFEMWSKQVKDPFQLIKLGLALTDKKDYESALKLFDRVISEEPKFSEPAYYYRVYANTKKEDFKSAADIELIANDLEYVEKQLKKRIESALNSAHIINHLKDRNKMNIVQIESFKEQQINVSKTYETILQSIYSAIGNKLTPESFSLPPEIDDHTRENLYNNLIELNFLTKPKITKVSLKDLSFAFGYGQTPQNIFEVLNNNSFKYEKILENKSFKKELKLPSRELFWQELIDKNILTEEEKYIFLDSEKLKCFDPSFYEEIIPYCEYIKNKENKLWLYHPKEIPNDKEMKMIKKTQIPEDKYKKLKKKGVMFSNSQATLNVQTKDIDLPSFDSLTLKDFDRLGTDIKVAENILAELEECLVIKQSLVQDNVREYKLQINAEEIDNIKLSTHRAYSNDVKNLLRYCFAFRIAFNRINLENQEVTEICIPLQKKLHKNIINELQLHNIIQPSTVNCDKNGAAALKNLYSKYMNTQSYESMFQELYDKKKSNLIVQCLIKNNCLVKDTSISNKVLEKIKTDQRAMYSINENILKNPIKGLERESKTIKIILQRHLDLVVIGSKIDKFIQDILECSKGRIYDVDTLDFSLVPLTKAMEMNNYPISECDIFTLNGFDQVLRVKEKKYTNKMKVMTFSIAMLGVTEIAAGTFLLLVTLNPISGSVLLSEGMGDIIFAVKCTCNGYCTLKDFLISKAIHLSLSLLTAISSFKKVFSSMFGEKCSGLSWQSIKQKCSFMLEKATEFGNKWFGKSTTVITSTVFKTIAKRVAISTAQGVGLGLAYSAVGNVVQEQSEKIADSISYVIYSDMDSTVDAHAISAYLPKCIAELQSILTVQEATRFIDSCFLDIINKHKTKTENSLFLTVSKFKTDIMPIISNFKYSSLTGGNLDVQAALSIGLLVKEIIDVVNNGRKYCAEVRDMVTKIMDDLYQLLSERLNKLKEDRYKYNERNLKTPIGNQIDRSKLIESWKNGIRNLLADQIQQDIIYPILTLVSNEFLIYATSVTSKACYSPLTEDEVMELSKFRKQYNFCSESKANMLKKVDFADLQYENHLLVLKKQRRASIFLESARKKAPLDICCIQLFCRVILQALRSEGIKVPGMKVVLVRDGVQEEFSTSDENVQMPTVVFDEDQDFVTNIVLNKPLVKHFFDKSYNAILKSNPEYKGITADFLHLIVMNYAIDLGFSFLTKDVDVDSSPSYEPNIDEFNSINRKVEAMTPYENTSPSGKWMFCPVVDVDLRKEKILSYPKEIKHHVLDGFTTALDKINNHIANLKAFLQPQIKLSLDDFEKTKHEICLKTDMNSLNLFDCLPIEYKLLLPLLVTNDEQSEMVDFSVNLSLISNATLKPHSPNGPHVVYNFSPKTSMKHLDRSIKGHILLSIKSSSKTYTAKDCHIAGELILPTNLREKYDTLIIGDSMFNHISEYIHRSNWKAVSYGDKIPSKLEPKIFSLIKLHPNVKCVVLYFGMFAIKPHMTVKESFAEIRNIVTEIKSQTKNTIKIVACTVALTKPKVATFRMNNSQNSQDRVNKINQKICKLIHLLRYFSELHDLTLFETNTYITPSCLGKDGVHLNKKGYWELVKGLYEVC